MSQPVCSTNSNSYTLLNAVYGTAQPEMPIPLSSPMGYEGVTPVSPSIDHNTVGMYEVMTDQLLPDHPVVEVSSSKRVGSLWNNIYLDNKSLKVTIIDTTCQETELLEGKNFICNSSSLTYDGLSENITCTNDALVLEIPESVVIDGSVTCQTTLPLDSQSESVSHKLEQLICKVDPRPTRLSPSSSLKPLTTWERIKDVGSKIISKTAGVVTNYILPTNIPALAMEYATLHTVSDIYAKRQKSESIGLKDVVKLGGCALGTAVCVFYATPVYFIPTLAIPVTGALGVWLAKTGYTPLAKKGWEGLPESLPLALMASVAIGMSIPTIGEYSL